MLAIMSFQDDCWSRDIDETSRLLHSRPPVLVPGGTRRSLVRETAGRSPVLTSTGRPFGRGGHSYGELPLSLRLTRTGGTKGYRRDGGCFLVQGVEEDKFVFHPDRIPEDEVQVVRKRPRVRVVVGL